MSLIRKLAGETLVYGLGSVLPKILNYILLAPYLTRVLTEKEYGSLGIIFSYAAIGMVLFTMRMETAFFRFATLDKEKESSFSTVVIAIFVVATLLLIPLIIWDEQVASIVTSSDHARYVRWFGFILLFDALSAIPFAKLRLENKAYRFSMIKILNVVINFSIIFFFLSICPRIVGGDGSFLSTIYQSDKNLDYVFIGNIVASACVFLLLLPEFRNMKFRFNASLFRKMIAYSWPLIIIGIAAAINTAFDREFISELLPGTPDENLKMAGIYNGAMKIAVLMSLFATAFNYAAEPFFFKTFDNKNAPENYAKIALIFTLVGCVVFLGIALNIDIAQFLIGGSFRSGVEVVPILLMAYLFLGLYYNISIWYKLKDKTIYGAIIALGGMAITIGMNWMLIPTIGYTGAAWSVLACFIFYCVAGYLTGQRFYPVPYAISKMATFIIIAVGIYFLHLWIKNSVTNILMMTGINIVLILIYLAIAYTMEGKLIKELLIPNRKK